MKSSTKIKPYRVLSLDGGGMRGLYTASLLSVLADRFAGNPKGESDIGKGFDLIVGTSTGCILAAGLMAGVHIAKIIDLYKEHGSSIFTDPIPDSVPNKISWGLVRWLLRNINKSANTNTHLLSVLHEIFCDETLEEVYARRSIGFCVPSVNMTTHKAQVFKTPHSEIRTADNSRKIFEVCMASSAAPIILPLAKVNDPNIKGAHTYYADGGLWANNPVLIGLIEALEMSDLDQPIEIVTIGTCSPPRGTVIEGSENSMGLYAWRGGVNVLDLSMDAQSSGYEYMAHHFAKQCRKLKKEITVERIDHSPPSSDQARLLSLDNASESACQVLIGRGLTDALAIHGKATSGDGSYPVISAIFSSLPKLNNEVS